MTEAVDPAGVPDLPEVDGGDPIVVPPQGVGSVPAPCAESCEPMVALDAGPIQALHTYRSRGWPHTTDRAWVRRGVRDRLVAAADMLPDGFGLAVFDAWRSPELQRALFDATYASGGLAPGFVADPDDATMDPPHTTGGTVDLTLTWRGIPLALGTGFDDFTDLAHVASFEQRPGPVRNLRRLLWNTLHEVGFGGYSQEWWHYSYGNSEWAALDSDRRCRYAPCYPSQAAG